MQQAADFLSDVNALSNLLDSLSDADFDRETGFKAWTINDIIGHLHMFDMAALKTSQDPAAFDSFYGPVDAAWSAGQSMLVPQWDWLGDLRGHALRDKWLATAREVHDVYTDDDPKRRLRWAGPDMSARSLITSRQMEVWAHGHEIFDLLGVERAEQDSIRNVVHLGVVTCGWTFANRGLIPTSAPPFVDLTAPSGARWTWGDETAQAENGVIKGSAVGFAQIVTQVRNWGDTDIVATGQAAETWMRYAQCFAGPPVDPPAVGTRFREGT